MSTKFTRLSGGEPLFSYVYKLRRIRSGSRISRLFRHIFQHTNIKRILGSQLALMLVASSFIPNFETKSLKATDVQLKEDIAVLRTERSITKPLDKLQINQGYHFFHPGIDYEGTTGEPVYSISSGQVTNVEYSRFGYGKVVYIDHDNKLSSLYAHLSETNVQKGQAVKSGDVIGKVGSTGRSTGDHLHIEVRYEGSYVNPLSVIPIN